MYGLSPRRFITIIKMNIEMIRGVTPRGEEGSSRRENSECSFLKIKVQVAKSLFLSIHREVGTIKNMAPRLTQFGSQEDEGSKTEKIFVIILILKWYRYQRLRCGKHKIAFQVLRAERLRVNERLKLLVQI